MFGYIRPLKAELLVREFEQYKSVYCTLCRSLGTHYGALSRMALSYDCTFFALFMLAIAERCPGFEQKHCVVNPMKRCTFCTGGTDAFAYASALSVILTYWKVRDDLSDSRFWGKLRAGMLRPFAAAARRKAKKAFPEMDRLAEDAIRSQAMAENGPAPTVDACAAPMAELLSALFSLLAATEAEKRLYAQFGYFLGRWVYLIDAADDMERDVRTGAFNPFARRFFLTPAATAADWRAAREECNRILNHSLWQAVTAMQLMEFHQFGPIIENIVAKGLPEMQRITLFTKEKDKEKEKTNVGSI